MKLTPEQEAAVMLIADDYRWPRMCADAIRRALDDPRLNPDTEDAERYRWLKKMRPKEFNERSDAAIRAERARGAR